MNLQAHYDAMWERAWPDVSQGRVDCDPQLSQGPDPRRGLTLIARPGAAVGARLDAALDALERIETGQYRQPPSDVHLTVLPLFTAAVDHGAQLARLDAYRDAVHCALRDMPGFRVDVRGLTMSRGAVLAQGYPCDGSLELLREKLRAALRARGLDATLDQRYRLVTAHMTLLRFQGPLARPAVFAQAVAGLRDEPFGIIDVSTLELVLNDWYMRSATLERIETLALGPVL